jgi:hypothetical protein
MRASRMNRCRFPLSLDALELKVSPASMPVATAAAATVSPLFASLDDSDPPPEPEPAPPPYRSGDSPIDYPILPPLGPAGPGFLA